MLQMFQTYLDLLREDLQTFLAILRVICQYILEYIEIKFYDVVYKEF